MKTRIVYQVITISAWSMSSAICPASFLSFFGIQGTIEVCCHRVTSANLCIKELREINELCQCTTSRAQWLTQMTDINGFTWHETDTFLQNAGHSPEYPPINGNCCQSSICHLLDEEKTVAPPICGRELQHPLTLRRACEGQPESQMCVW